MIDSEQIVKKISFYIELRNYNLRGNPTHSFQNTSDFISWILHIKNSSEKTLNSLKLYFL